VDFSKVLEKIKKLIQKNESVFVGNKPRVMLIYNPRSTKASLVEEKVIKPLREFKGIVFGKYEVKPTNVDDNANSLAKVLNDGDIVIAAGGDGTATIGLNGVVLSKKEVHFTAVPFGNFNDMARTLKRASGKKIYPLEAVVNGKHFRYAACYFTIGMFAESTEVFDEDKNRKRLRKKKKNFFFSLKTLFKWYLKNKRKTFIPEFELITCKVVNGEMDEERKVFKKASDYIASNGATVAKLMKGKKGICSDDDTFLATAKSLRSIFALGMFMVKSVLFRIPGEIVVCSKMYFDEPAKVEIQAEGEYKKLENVEKIEIRKVDNPIKIL
jgi:diacylglycerol kinase family enzyme